MSLRLLGILSLADPQLTRRAFGLAMSKRGGRAPKRRLDDSMVLAVSAVLSGFGMIAKDSGSGNSVGLTTEQSMGHGEDPWCEICVWFLGF